MVPGGYDAIVDEIERLRPDFVTFSEVRNYHGIRFCDRIVASLRERGLEYYSFYSYDSGLLSRHPITDSTTARLRRLHLGEDSHPADRPRGAAGQ